MKLKITSPERVVFEWDIQKINISTENGYIWILPWHVPLTTVVKPWIAKITVPAEKKEHLVKSSDFLFDENEDIIISVSKWLLFLDWESILVTTSAATTNPWESEEALLTSKQSLEKNIEELKAKWSLEDMEKAFMDLEKIHADLKLFKMKGIVK